MKKISAPMTFFYKRIFPVLWFGSIAVFVALTARIAAIAPMLLIPAGLSAMGVFIFRRLLFDLMDEVYDAGDALVVRNAGEEERISLTNIMNVSYQSFVNPPRITLSLRNPSRFGPEISFIPKLGFGQVLYRKNPMVEDLISRVDAARYGR